MGAGLVIVMGVVLLVLRVGLLRPGIHLPIGLGLELEANVSPGTLLAPSPWSPTFLLTGVELVIVGPPPLESNLSPKGPALFKLLPGLLARVVVLLPVPPCDLRTLRCRCLTLLLLLTLLVLVMVLDSLPPPPPVPVSTSTIILQVTSKV